MTAPYAIQPLPIPNVGPTGFAPAPTGGDQFYQGAHDLAAVLQAVQNASIQSQANAWQHEVGMGQVGVQQGQLAQKIAEEAQKRQDAITQGNTIIQLLGGQIPGLQGMDPAAVAAASQHFTDWGLGRGPLTTNERDFTRLQGLDPNAGAPDFRKLIMPPDRSVNVNVDTKGQSAFATGFGGGQAQQALKDLEASRASGAAFDRDERILGYVKNAITGAGANAKLQAARLATLFGAQGKFKNEVEATQLFQAEAARVVGNMITTGQAGRGNLNPQELAFLQRMAGQDISLDAGTIAKLTRIRYQMEIGDEEARIAGLRQNARSYPDNAPQLNAEADRMERALQPRRAKLAQMVQVEGKLEKQQQINDRKDIKQQQDKYGLPPLPGGTP